MGTYTTIKIHDLDKTDAAKKDAANKAFDEIQRLEGLLSNFKEGNIIDKINYAGTGEVSLDKEVFFILEQAKYFSKISDGAFDITILPLLELWGFHKKNYSVPPRDEIEKALAKVGSDKLILDNKKRSVRFQKEGMKIGLGGIVPGYAVDRAIFVLRQNGIKTAMVDLGGEIYCLGRSAKYKRWSIGIKDPVKKTRVMEKLDMEDMAVSTSGEYENFFEVGPKRYGHIIDPRTGYPVENNLESVTVIAKDCLSADVLATAVFVLGEGEGRKLIENIDGVKAIIITKEGKRLVFQKVR